MVGFKDGAAVRLQGRGGVVRCNYLGVDLAGSAVPNLDGVDAVDAIHVTIGGPRANSRNVISGNDGHGVFVQRSTVVSIIGNSIGSDVADQGRLGNGGLGVWIEGGGSNFVGRDYSAGANLIVANGAGGVLLSHSDANEVVGNYIGEGSTPGTDLGNGAYGVFIYESPNSQIGKAAPGSVACGSAPATGGTTVVATGSTTVVRPSTPTTVGRLPNPTAQGAPGNVISHNRGPGVGIQGAYAH